VTSPALVGAVPQLVTTVQRMKRDAIQRDQDMLVIRTVRAGHPEKLFPDLFNDVWRKQIVANWIDSTAREFAEMIAPLPALNCSSKGNRTNADKARAAKKNQIGAHYWKTAKLAKHMVSHADRYLSYGFAPFVAEPDYRLGAPMIRLEDPVGAYFDLDRYGNCVRYAKCYLETVATLCARFPELAGRIKHKTTDFGLVACDGDERLEVVRYTDAERTVMFLPARSGLILTSFDNPISRCPVAIAVRPGLFDEPEGQFTQVVWVQLARHRMALLGLEAGVKAVGAPLAVPRDVVEMGVGADAVIQTDSPEKIRRVGIEVPNSTFALQETLESELRQGARMPEGRNGGIQASVITGRGVQALQGSFDTQIQTAQRIFGECLEEVTAFCFEMDEKVWPNTKKTIEGTMAGEPYSLDYTPAADIAGNWTCSVSYGYAAGLAPNQAIVMLLQLRGDSLIDRATVQRQLPFDINVEQMQRNIDLEQTADAAKQGLFGLLSAMGQIAAGGQDPRPIMRATAHVMQGRRAGKALEDLMIEAFSPEVMDPEAAAAQAAAAQAGPDAAAGGEPAPAGPPEGVAPDQVGMAPGGQPDLQMLIAGLRNGKPQLDAQVSRRLPVA
jgi:hypothetical protein